MSHVIDFPASADRLLLGSDGAPPNALRALASNEGCELITTSDARHALQLARGGRTCCTVVHFPLDTARSFCRDLRLRGMLTPILVLVPAPAATVAGQLLTCGADRVLDANDEPRLSLHLRAILRRARGRLADHQLCGPLRLDHRHRRARVDGDWLDLTSADFQLLSLLCRKPNCPIPIAELATELFRREATPCDRRAVIQRALRLRRKLGAWGERIAGNDGTYQFLTQPSPS